MNRAGSLLVVFAFLQGQGQTRIPRFHETTIVVGRGPQWVSVADVNHDGLTDLIVANAESETISVLLGNAAGEFHLAPGSPFPAGHLPNDIAVADMNCDGFPDIVIANHQSPYLRVMLGNGKGSFRLAPGSPVEVHSNPHPHGVVARDFNGDGKVDVMTDSWASNQVELLLGDGKGGLLTPGRFFPVGHRPYERLRSADFNGDGVPDLVTTNLDDGAVSVLLGDGKGGFRNAPASPFAAGAKPWQVAVADVNEDGNADLVVLPYQRDIASPAENKVTVLLGDGHGSFRPGPPLSLGNCRGPNGVAAGPLQQHQLAIAIHCAESRTMQLFERSGDGSFVTSSIPIKGGWGSIALIPAHDQRKGAIVTANHDDGSITIYSAN